MTETLVSQEQVDGATDEQLAGLLLMVAARLLALQAEAPVEYGTRFLTAQEAAEISGLRSHYFYDHADELPYTVRVSERRVRFEERGLREWMRTRGGSGEVVSAEGGAQRAGRPEPKGGGAQGGPGPQGAFWRG